LLVGRLIFTPKEDTNGRYYEFPGKGSISELLTGVVLPKGWWPQRDSNPCFSYDHVFATFLRHLWDKTALGVGVIKTRSPQGFSKPRSDRRFWISGPMCTNPWWRSFPGKYVPATGMS